MNEINLPKKKKVKMIGLELDKALMDKVKEIAEKEECSQTDVLNTAIQVWINYYKKITKENL